jgi:hypothetical protein
MDTRFSDRKNEKEKKKMDITAHPRGRKDKPKTVMRQDSCKTSNEPKSGCLPIEKQLAVC